MSGGAHRGLDPAAPRTAGGPLAAVVALTGALALILYASVSGGPAAEISLVTLAIVSACLLHRWLFAWHTLLALITVVILFIPIRRYTVSGDLPFELEPYRVLVAFVVAGWGLSLMADERVRFRRTGLEAPLALIGLGTLGSIALNPDRVAEVNAEVVKGTLLLVSFILVLYLAVGVCRSRGVIDGLLMLLVAGGAVLAVFALVEAHTERNAFNSLSAYLPFLELSSVPREQGRGARLRAYASAEHAIALSALLVMLMPVAGYLAVRQRRLRAIWLASVAVLFVGVMATASRTGVVMLIAAGIVLAVLRPSVIRAIALAAIPAAALTHLLLPGALGSLRKSFFPEGGLLEEQRGQAGEVGSGRIADIGPGLREWMERPLFGQGHSTRVVDGPTPNALIFDNQWLVTLVEVGAVGFAGWLLLFIIAVRRTARLAREDAGDRGWLAVTLCASLTAFATGMFVFDAFSFTQVTFVAFLLLAFAAVLTEDRRRAPRALSLGRRPRQEADGRAGGAG